MFLTVHLAVGALVCKNLTNPIVAFILGLFSHFLLDAIPHGDEGLNKNTFLSTAAIDLAVFCFFVFVIFNKIDFLFPRVVSWGILGAMTPDLFLGVSKVINIKIFNFGAKINSFFHQIIKAKISLKAGLIVQSVFLILSLLGLFL